jgi:hypothetical protein
VNISVNKAKVYIIFFEKQIVLRQSLLRGVRKFRFWRSIFLIFFLGNGMFFGWNKLFIALPVLGVIILDGQMCQFFHQFFASGVVALSNLKD